MLARIEERVFGRKEAAERAWKQVLNEAPEDRAAQRAVQRLEQRERLAGQKRQQRQS